MNHEVFYAYNKNNQLKQQRELLGGTSDNYNGFIEVVKDYDYDTNGNAIRQTTSGQVDESIVEYTYNQWNQMTQYKGADGSIATYTYDGTGMRTSKTYNDVMTKFYWDRGYISNEAVNGTFTANNYIGAQGIFARESEDATNYMFKNGHGDVVKLVSNGTVTQNYDFNAYGNQKVESNTADTNPFRYCGEYFDQESGFIYLRSRYYDPSMGRFITEDPVKDGTNWFVYCENDPVNRIDITGKEWGYIRDFANSISCLFIGSPQYTQLRQGDRYTSVRVNLGNGYMSREGTFSYNGYANVTNNGGRSFRYEKIAQNNNGRLYMDRTDFYRAMNISYAVSSREFDVSWIDNQLQALATGALVTAATAGAGTWTSFGLGFLADLGVSAFQKEPGHYKVIYTVAQVYNVVNGTYDSVLTTEYYKLEYGYYGEPQWVRYGEANTQYNGSSTESYIY